MVIRHREATQIAVYIATIVATATLTWKLARALTEDEVADRVREIRDYYKNKTDIERLRSQVESKAYPAEAVPEQSLEDLLEDYGSAQFTNEPIEVRVLKEEKKKLHPKSHQSIHVLTLDEFYADEDPDFPDQEKVSGTYYVVDDVVVDQYDEVMQNHRNLVGDLAKTPPSEDDPERIFVRNTVLKLDYEIDIDRGSYESDVLGFDPPPPEARTPMKFRDRE